MQKFLYSFLTPLYHSIAICKKQRKKSNGDARIKWTRMTLCEKHWKYLKGALKMVKVSIQHDTTMNYCISLCLALIAQRLHFELTTDFIFLLDESKFLRCNTIHKMLNFFSQRFRSRRENNVDKNYELWRKSNVTKKVTKRKRQNEQRVEKKQTPNDIVTVEKLATEKKIRKIRRKRQEQNRKAAEKCQEKLKLCLILVDIRNEAKANAIVSCTECCCFDSSKKRRVQRNRQMWRRE